MEEDRTPSWHNNERKVGVSGPPTWHRVGLGVGALLGCYVLMEYVCMSFYNNVKVLLSESDSQGTLSPRESQSCDEYGVDACLFQDCFFSLRVVVTWLPGALQVSAKSLAHRGRICVELGQVSLRSRQKISCWFIF